MVRHKTGFLVFANNLLTEYSDVCCGKVDSELALMYYLRLVIIKS